MLTDPCTTELIDVGAYVLRDTNVVIFVNVWAFGVLQNDKAYPAMEDKEIQWQLCNSIKTLSIVLYSAKAPEYLQKDDDI